MTQRNNKDLAKLYDSFYKKGDKKHYTKLIFKKSSENIPEEESQALHAIPSWKGKTVLDVGCGTGLLVHELAKRGAKLSVGIDFSAEAIKVAKETHKHKNVKYLLEDLDNHKGKYDVVVSLGTLEHMDNPLSALKKMKKLLSPKGVIIITSPNWTNPRGYILQTLRFLFDAPITLADLHYLTPIDFVAWAKKLQMKLSWKTFDFNWAHGGRLIQDFKRRLPNVLIRDMKEKVTQKQIDNFIDWIEKHIVALPHNLPFSGALGLYVFKK